MGRSRAVSRAAAAAEQNPGLSKSKRKRIASITEGAISPSLVVSSNAELPSGQGLCDGKIALYHCNYCRKDISGRIRIKCVVCPDFDLCIECFSVGAEVTPHKCHHPYRVMDNLSFPLICPSWNADEEMLLLEGIEMYGFGNWSEVSQHVGTKTKFQCVYHYDDVYMNSPYFPLPDLSHVMGKSREELIATAKEHGEVKRETSICGEPTVKEEIPCSKKIKFEEFVKEDPLCQSLHSLPAEVAPGIGPSSGKKMTKKKALTKVQEKDKIKKEEYQSERSICEKRPRISGDGPSVTELSGYNSKRGEFEVEYDNDAEQLLADMEFKETDTDAERNLKLQVLHIYSKRLDERKRRKDFILERNLLSPNSFEKNLSPEEREICQKYKVFMRFHSKDEHEQLLSNILEQQRMIKKIQELQDARAAGYQTSVDAYRYIAQKKQKEAEESANRMKESFQIGPAGKSLKILSKESESSSSALGRGSVGLQCGDSEQSSTTTESTTPGLLDKWDVSGLIGANLLSETERQLCGEIRILPSHYLKMLQTISTELSKGKLTTKSDLYTLFKVEPGKVDRVYDMLLKKGVAVSPLA